MKRTGRKTMQPVSDGHDAPFLVDQIVLNRPAAAD